MHVSAAKVGKRVGSLGYGAQSRKLKAESQKLKVESGKLQSALDIVPIKENAWSPEFGAVSFGLGVAKRLKLFVGIKVLIVELVEHQHIKLITSKPSQNLLHWVLRLKRPSNNAKLKLALHYSLLILCFIKLIFAFSNYNGCDSVPDHIRDCTGFTHKTINANQD